MLGFVQGCLNQDSRIDKLQKEEASYYEAWPIKIQELTNCKKKKQATMKLDLSKVVFCRF